MLAFFEKVMMGSPQGDWQDKLFCKPDFKEQDRCMALYRIASELERLAAHNSVRYMRSLLDISLFSRMTDGTPPLMLTLTTSGAHSELQGHYARVSGMAGNGYPVWKKKDAEHWLFTDTNGY